MARETMSLEEELELVSTRKSLRIYPSVPYSQVTSYQPSTKPLTVTMAPSLTVASVPPLVEGAERTFTPSPLTRP